MQRTLIHRYESLVKQGLLRHDAEQLRCLARLQGLLDDLRSYGAALRTWEVSSTEYEARKRHALEQQRRHNVSRESSSSSSSLSWSWTSTLVPFPTAWFSSAGVDAPNANANVYKHEVESTIGPPPTVPTAPRGVYLHGSVGTGKTFMMDLFYEQIQGLELDCLPHRRRMHINAAMLELHAKQHALEREREAMSAMPEHRPDRAARLARLAQRRLWRERLKTPADVFERALASSNASILLHAARGMLYDGFEHSAFKKRMPAPLLCFDEVQTTDPFTAAALKALTETAFEDGGVLVATSNRAPTELSSHGLHAALFNHFVEAIQSHCDVVELNSGQDYRRQGDEGRGGAYFWPLGSQSDAQLEAAWNAIEPCRSWNDAGQFPGTETTVPVAFGRELQIPKRRGGAVWFDFDELCERPLGSADYAALAATCEVLFLRGVPALSMRRRDLARRFISLVDELYERRRRLVCSAAVPPDALFAGDDGGDDDDETMIELLEGMQSERGVVVQPTAERMAGLGGEEERFAFARAVSRLWDIAR